MSDGELGFLSIEETARRFAARSLSPLELIDALIARAQRLDPVLKAYLLTTFDQARDAVRRKVESLFPPHELDAFTDHFWGLLQFWRKTEADRIGLTSGDDKS